LIVSVVAIKSPPVEQLLDRARRGEDQQRLIEAVIDHIADRSYQTGICPQYWLSFEKRQTVSHHKIVLVGR
jgi:hypothetical protein